MGSWLIMFSTGICSVKVLQRSPLRRLTFNIVSARHKFKITAS